MLDFTIDIAYRAGAILRAGQERERVYEAKQHADLVTDMDKASEALIIQAIRERFPDHAILAEESGASPGKSGYTWVIDPLDGTLNYFHGMPFYCVSIGLVYADSAHAKPVPMLGVVYDPSRNELFAAERGRGAFCNGRRMQVSRTTELHRTMLTTGFPYDRFTQPDNNLREFAHMLLKVQDIRRPGSAALDLAYVAAGRSDGYWERSLNSWDVTAGMLLVSEAGGKVTDWQGQTAEFGEPHLVASNGLIHATIIEELAYVRGQ